MSVIKEIQAITSWYGNGGYQKSSLVELQNSKSKLLTLCITFADEVASAKKDSLVSTVFRKVDHHKIKSRLIDEGLGLGISETKAMEENAEKMRIEAEHEALSYYYSQVLRTCYMIAQDITQRISILRLELAN
ncbi:MAG: hypothetical protein KAS32_15950, partial [Candidatus Peribacteraceae bacterium]|nr:hypothetical protein [Candidatus Peribacteraceae bacterium]